MRMNFGFGETYCSGCHYCIGYFLQPPCTVVLSRLFFLILGCPLRSPCLRVSAPYSITVVSYYRPNCVRQIRCHHIVALPWTVGFFLIVRSSHLAYPVDGIRFPREAFPLSGGNCYQPYPLGVIHCWFALFGWIFLDFFFVKLTRRKHFRKFSQVYWKIDLWFPPKLILRSSLWSPTV